jgi:hypothetical protein
MKYYVLLVHPGIGGQVIAFSEYRSEIAANAVYKAATLAKIQYTELGHSWDGEAVVLDCNSPRIATVTLVGAQGVPPLDFFLGVS